MKNSFQWPNWLNRNIVGFSFASTLSDTSHEIVPLVLPILLSQLVGNQAAPKYVALISGISGIVSSLAALFSGILSDYIPRRKPLILLGYFLTGSLVGLLSIAHHWFTVLILMSGAWLGRGLISAPRNALIAHSTDKKYYGRAFGFRQAFDTLGAILGPLIVYAFSFLPINQLFLIALIPGILAFFVVYFFIEDSTQAPSRYLVLTKWLITLTQPLPREFYSLLGVFFLFGIASFNKTLIIFRIQEIFLNHMNITKALAFVTMLYTFRNMVQALASYMMGALSDKIGRTIPLVIFGFGFFALMSLLLALPTPSSSGSILWAGSIFFLSGVSAGTYTSLQKSLIADTVPDFLRGMGYGMLEIVNQVGNFISSIVLALIWSSFGPQAAFIVAACLSFTSMAFHLIAQRRMG